MSLVPTESRQITEIVQNPDATNDPTLIGGFDDSPLEGSDDHIVEVQIESAPMQ